MHAHGLAEREICNCTKVWNKLTADPLALRQCGMRNGADIELAWLRARAGAKLCQVLENNLFEIWSTLFLSPAPSSTPQVLNKLE